MTWGDRADYSHNTVVGGAFYSRDEPPEVVTPEAAKTHNAVADRCLFLKEGDSPDAGFADPVRSDYRLRSDSPYLGQGAFPDPAPLRYVSPAGDDAADGRTPKSAWKTLAKAASGALPGETVYVLPGTYPESIKISTQATLEEPLALKTKGTPLWWSTAGRRVLCATTTSTGGRQFPGWVCSRITSRRPARPSGGETT